MKQNSGVNLRRVSSLKRLEGQLKKGVKLVSRKNEVERPYTEKEIEKINKEIETLKSRVVHISN